MGKVMVSLVDCPRSSPHLQEVDGNKSELSFFFSISFSTVSLWIHHHNGVAKAERQFFFC